MTRLIDADLLKLEIACVYGSNPQYINWLNHAPTVDAVPVIRCKDCRYWQDNQIGHYPNELCPWDKGETPDEDDYCSFAERKEE